MAPRHNAFRRVMSATGDTRNGGRPLETGWQDLPELKHLGANLLLARLERGYSQERLARDCKLSQAQVSLFEAGRRLPSLDQFVRLARSLGVPLQRLLTGSNRPGVGLKDLAVD